MTLKFDWFIGLEWVEGMEDETSGWSDAFETKKGVVFIDLPLIVTIERDLSALNSRPAQVGAVGHPQKPSVYDTRLIPKTVLKLF